MAPTRGGIATSPKSCAALKTGEVKNDACSRALTFPVKAEDGKVLVDAEVLYMQPTLEEEEVA